MCCLQTGRQQPLDGRRGMRMTDAGKGVWCEGMQAHKQEGGTIVLGFGLL